MDEIGHLLETMHPMREPPLPEPIAPALLLLALGALAALVVAAIFYMSRRRRPALDLAVAATLRAAEALPTADRLAVQATVLRRLVRALGAEEESRLQGADWLAALDRLLSTDFFTCGAGQIFGDLLYRRPDGIDLEALDDAILTFAKRASAKSGFAKSAFAKGGSAEQASLEDAWRVTRPGAQPS